MALYGERTVISGIAGETLTSKQHYLVKIDTDEKWDLNDTAGEACHGVLEGATGDATAIATNAVISVCTFGVTKVVAAGALNGGVLIQGDGTGKVTTAAGADYPVGYTIEAAAADGDVIKAFVNPQGAQINA